MSTPGSKKFNEDQRELVDSILSISVGKMQNIFMRMEFLILVAMVVLMIMIVIVIMVVIMFMVMVSMSKAH